MLFGKYMIRCIVLSVFLAGCVTTPAESPTVESGTIVVESGTVIVETEDVSAVIVFSDSDRDKIRRYYSNMKKTKRMPPGLAKKQELPPGLQKHIAKYGELPPGLEGRGLPQDLEGILSHLPAGFVRLQVGVDVVLLNKKTRIVLDVIWDVLRMN
jgi:hypothetical protein